MQGWGFKLNMIFYLIKVERSHLKQKQPPQKKTSGAQKNNRNLYYKPPAQPTVLPCKNLNMENEIFMVRWY